MRKIVWCPSRGDRVRRALFLLSFVGVASGAASADSYSEGTAAFAEQDYTSAAAFWREAAEEGSAEAKFQLGLLSDLGLGTPRKPDVAFRYYLEAAEMGLPEAAFNVGVMLDSGIGVPRDSVAAIVWYARAALAGNVRAAFNLGLLYRDGRGGPANVQIAAHWLRAVSSSIPAAREALQELRIETSDDLEAPVPLTAHVARMGPRAFADLVWTAAPGPQQSLFAVQVVPASETDPFAASIWTQETEGSAVRMLIRDGGFLWRVARIDPANDRYEVGPWQRQDAADTPDPTGIVSIVVAQDDPNAIATAGKLARALAANALTVRLIKTSEPRTESAILYRYTQDADLARDLSNFLPGFRIENVALSDTLSAGPGEIVVHLVLGSAGPVIP